MKRFFLHLTLALSLGMLLFTSFGCDPDATYTTVYVVRHAEKIDASDPQSLLSPAGHARAEALSDRLSGIELSGVYATNIERTQQTAAPTAEAQGLDITIFPWQDHEDMVADLLANHAGGVVLVVGHSNTVSPTIETLHGEAVEVGENDYNNLWLVLHSSNGTAGVTVVPYGAPNPAP